MIESLAELQRKVREQKDKIPSLYGDVDFSIVPERFAGDMSTKSMLPDHFAKKYRADILANDEQIQRSLAYTMLGDTVADAYAALMPEYGFRNLIKMLTDACDYGVGSVENAPAELVAFIQAMEKKPDWLDMELVHKGARISRNAMANLSPYAIRGAFIATFMNKYSGLPMALTGTLSDQGSVQRVKETASFFTTATLPGALDRFGPGFKAAAMVRLMHSMVRFNILKRSKVWDVAIYGIPVPQVDQMPAGTIPAFLAAFKVIRNGGRTFNDQDRAVVELCRYQSYLLGLPEDLLPAEPQAIFNTMMTYAGTLRDGYDDSTCGELTRTTIGAYMPSEKTVRNQIYNALEKSYSKVFFTRAFLVGKDKSRAELMGVKPSAWDYLLCTLATSYVLPRFKAHELLQRVPIVRHAADQLLIKRLNKLLVEYGHAEYTTDPSKYKDESARGHHAL